MSYIRKGCKWEWIQQVWVPTEQAKHPKCQHCGEEIVVQPHHYWYGVPRFINGHYAKTEKSRTMWSAIGKKNVERGKILGKENVESGHMQKMWEAQCRRPTSPEQLVIDFNISSLWYCGNGKFWIKIDGHWLNPDFKVHGKKKGVEVFGSYWHKGEDPQDRIDLFKKAGYECLVIWENDLKKCPGYYRQLLEAFCRGIEYKSSFRGVMI